MKYSLIVIFLLVVSTLQYSGLIKKQYDGVTIGNPDAPFHLENYIDLLCTESKLDHETWKKVFKLVDFENQDKVKITFHQHPNVQHVYDWPIVMVQHYILETYGNDVAYQYQNFILDNQVQFKHNDWSIDTLIDRLATILSANRNFQQVGLQKQEIVEAANTRKYDLQSRISWLYGNYKSITSTPEYYANGALLANNNGWSVQQWLQFLDEYAGLKQVDSDNFLE